MLKPFHVLISHTLVLLLLAYSAVSQAATVIEVQNKSDLMTVATNGQLARMNISGNEYALVDYRNQTVKVVSPQKQQVMLLGTDNMAAENTGPQVRTSIKNLGTGVTVAGYPTQKFAYSANGKPCGVIYGSMAVYQQQGIKELFQALKIMMDNQLAALGGLAGMMDDCMLADMKVGDHVKTVGVPMRTEKNGRIEAEIKSIKHGVDLPADTFVIPASYKTLTMQEQINAASQGMAKHQSQVQQSGQMTPEMMEQMRRSQQMMRQYQQR